MYGANLENLSQHKLFLMLLTEALPIIARDHPRVKRALEAGKVRSSEAPTLTVREAYVMHVYAKAFALLRSLERMQQARIYMGLYPRPKYYERRGLTKLAWLEYHYGYFIVSLTGLTDIALLLTNSVFRLGNKDRECKWNTIVKNLWVSQHGTGKTLEKLDGFCKTHRELRNEHVHAGKELDIGEVLNDDDIRMTSFIASMRPLADLLEDHEIEAIDVGELDEVIAFGSEMTEDGLCRRIDDDLERTIELTRAYLDTLVDVFKLWMLMLKRVEQTEPGTSGAET